MRQRSGLSLSLNFVVIALIASVVAITVILAFSGNFGDISEFIGGNIETSTHELAGQNCLADFDRLCSLQMYPAGATNWSTDATYNGKTCKYWIEQGALGGQIHGCGDPYEQ